MWRKRTGDTKVRLGKDKQSPKKVNEIGLDSPLTLGFKKLKGGKNMRYDLSKIMRHAWRIFYKYSVTFAEALHRAWQAAKAIYINNARVEAAKKAANIEEITNTWAAWRELGFEVKHGSKALFKAILIYASKGDGKNYTASFFGASQVQPIGEVAG